MNQQEEQEREKQREQFEAAMKHRFPTMVGIVSLGGETSKAAHKRNQEHRKQVLTRKATRHT